MCRSLSLESPYSVSELPLKITEGIDVFPVPCGPTTIIIQSTLVPALSIRAQAPISHLLATSFTNGLLSTPQYVVSQSSSLGTPSHFCPLIHSSMGLF